jgi:hypothetical protein
MNFIWTLLSWKEVSKVSFRSFKNTLKLFTNIAKNWKPTTTTTTTTTPPPGYRVTVEGIMGNVFFQKKFWMSANLLKVECMAVWRIVCELLVFFEYFLVCVLFLRIVARFSRLTGRCVCVCMSVGVRGWGWCPHEFQKRIPKNGKTSERNEFRKTVNFNELSKRKTSESPENQQKDH